MKQNRTNLALGVILLVVGGWLLVTRQVPSIQEWLSDHSTGSVYTIGAGLLILLVGLLTGAPGLAVPASIVAGVGGILYYQEAVGDYSSWSYLWTLIPAFVGIGSILAGVLGEDLRRNFSRGARLLVISGILFLIFATFFSGLPLLGEFGLPIILILLGLYVIARGFIRSNNREREENNEAR
jgi:hypothetical protein